MPKLMHTTSGDTFNYKAPNSKHALRLFLDFDGTITEKDTLHLVADVGYRVQARGNTLSCLPPWQEIVEAYLFDYRTLTETYHPIKSQRSSIQQEIEWSHSLQRIEEASAARATDSGIFDHVQRSDVVNAAWEALQSGKVKLRKGYGEFMSHVYTHNSRLTNSPRQSIPLTILSVNWSTSFIHAIATKVPGVTQAASDTFMPPAWTESLQVFANELPSVVISGPAQLGPHVIRTSSDKLRHFNDLCSKSCDLNERTLYIGDSTTDLECLLAAHTGICMREKHMGSSQQELGDTCQRLGIEVKHIYQKHDLETSTNLCLWWAHDFTEIQCWLQSLDGD